jgi:hypothetical protein
MVFFLPAEELLRSRFNSEDKVVSIPNTNEVGVWFEAAGEVLIWGGPAGVGVCAEEKEGWRGKPAATKAGSHAPRARWG